MTNPMRDATIAAALRPFTEAGVLAGAVGLVADADGGVACAAVGFADVAGGVAMRDDAVFWIASITKPMTAAALMMLVDEGKVSVEDPVERYLPEFAGQQVVVEQGEGRVVLGKPARPVTVRDVLSHTSGLPFMSRVERKIDERPLREAALSYAMTPLSGEPGTKYAYSNAGTNTVGRVIEVVAGVVYERFMRDRLFGPLGMGETTFFPSEAQVARLAKSYKPGAGGAGLVEIDVGQLTYPLTAAGRYACPAGGLFSTAGDVARFGLMILAGGTIGGRRYLSEAAVRQMTSTQTGTLQGAPGTEEGYGFGWGTTRRDGGGAGGPAPAGACGHSGAYGTDLRVDPASGRVAVFLIQHDYPRGAEAAPLAAFRAVCGRRG